MRNHHKSHQERGNATDQRRNRRIKGKEYDLCDEAGGEVLEPPFEMLHTMGGILSLVRLIRTYTEEEIGRAHV